MVDIARHIESCKAKGKDSVRIWLRDSIQNC